LLAALRQKNKSLFNFLDKDLTPGGAKKHHHHIKRTIKQRPDQALRVIVFHFGTPAYVTVCTTRSLGSLQTRPLEATQMLFSVEKSLPLV
jgi:hypothetical protein